MVASSVLEPDRQRWKNVERSGLGAVLGCRVQNDFRRDLQDEKKWVIFRGIKGR